MTADGNGKTSWHTKVLLKSTIHGTWGNINEPHTWLGEQPSSIFKYRLSIPFFDLIHIISDLMGLVGIPPLSFYRPVRKKHPCNIPVVSLHTHTHTGYRCLFGNKEAEFGIPFNYHETHHNLPLDMGVASGNLILLRGKLLIDPKNVDDLAIHFPYQTEFV